MKPLGIRYRILLAALAPAVLVAVLVSGMLVSQQLEQTRINQQRRIDTLARQLANAAEFSLFVGDYDGLLKLLDSSLNEPDVVGAAIAGPDGKFLASTVPMFELPSINTVADGFASPSVALSSSRSGWQRFPIRGHTLADSDLFASGKENETRLLGNLLLKVSNQSLHDDVNQQVMIAIGLSLLMLALGVMLALALSRGLIRTLTNIGEVVDNITHGRHYTPVQVPSSDELGELARGINQMADVVTETKEHLAQRIEDATISLRRERDDAAQASLARSRFFAAASHDLRQPVQALGLFAVRLERDARNTLLQDTAFQIAQSIRTLQGLLDTLLDYSRLDGQVFRTEQQPVLASSILSSMQAEFEPAATEKGLALRLRINDCWIQTDRALLHRILINLVSNAIRYTREGGVLIACRRGSSHAKIEVWDTGPGIPEDQREAIFNELVQLDNPERNAAKGLGLGLAIVRRVADLLAHPLRLNSRLGRGSCFSVTIPLAAPPVEDEDEEVAAFTPGAHFILLGDGLEDVRDSLEEWELPYLQAETSMEAAQFVKQIGRDAPVLICNSGTNISECLEQLDLLDATCGINVAALLIHNGPRPAAETRGLRRVLLARPFRPARLRALIDHLIEPEE